MTDAPRTQELKEGEKIPWGARIRLHRALKKGQTGLLLHAEIREPPRSISPHWSTVWVSESGEQLCACSKVERLPKFTELKPGIHKIKFIVTRRGKDDTSFAREINLGKGDIFVALCDPVQPNVFYRKSKEVDHWRLGIISSSNNG